MPIRSSPSAAAMELSAENQAELVSAREQAILLQGFMGARPGAVLGAVNTSAPTTAAPSDAAAPSVPSTEGTPTPMDTQAREGKRGSDWDSGKGADKYRRSAQVKGGGYGTGWGNKRQNEWWKKAKNDFDEENKREKDVEEIRNLCVSLSRLVLRHDDQQAIDRTEKGFILFCQTNGMLSVIPDMARCIEAWTKMKEDNPTGLTLPRRAAMLKQLLDLWFIRLEVVAETEESLSQAKNMLILNQAGQVPYLQYNRQTEQLEIKPDREPMELKTVLETIKELQDLVLLPNTTLRFHAARKLTSQRKGDIVPMMLEIGVRTREADRAWELLARPMSQRGLPCSGDEPAPRANGSLSLGEVGAADGRGFVRALLLGNSRNYCYSNAAFLALLWASVEHSGMMACESPMGPSLRMIVGWLRRKSGIVHLWQHLPWVTLHASWPQPHRQHDIIEYMQFLRPRLSSEVADCQWESRSGAGWLY